MTCPNCGSILDDRSQFCNHCGQAQQSYTQAFGNNAEGGEPHRRCYQQPTGDQNPGQGFNSTGAGGTAFNGKNNYLFLMICCFGWALLVGMPKAISFLATFMNPVARGDWNLLSWPSFSGFLTLGLQFVLPLAAGVFFLNKYGQSNAE